MLTQILSLNEVETFAKQIIAESVSFHPDDDFNDYVNLNENKPCYSKQDADFRNELMCQCFGICAKEAVDIYNLMLEITLIETRMDKFIALPSQK